MAMETSTKDSGKKGKDTEKAFTSIKKMADSKSLFLHDVTDSLVRVLFYLLKQSRLIKCPKLH